MSARKSGRTSRFVALGSVILAVAFSSSARSSDDSVQLTFLPEAGTTLTYKLEANSTLELVESTFVEYWEGREFPQETDETREIEQTERYTFVDEVVAVDEGRVTELIRFFEEIHSEHDNQGTAGEEDWSDAHSGTSSLQDQKVKFEWDEEQERYDCTLEAEEDVPGVDEEFLAGLDLDVYLRGMLPEGAVSIGDSWEVGADSYFLIVFPSGVLRITSHEGQDPTQDNGYELRDAQEGQVTLTLLEVEDSEDGSVAVLRVEVDCETSSRTEDDVEWEGVGSGTNATEITIESELSGEVRWNLDRHLPVSLQLSGTHRYERESIATVSGEREYENNYTTVMTGEIEFLISWE